MMAMKNSKNYSYKKRLRLRIKTNQAMKKYKWLKWG